MSEEIEALRRDLHVARDQLARAEKQLRDATENRIANSSSIDAISSLRQRLRTPLNTVLGFAQLLKSSPFGDCEAVQQIFTAANRLAELIEENPRSADGNGQRASEARRKRDNGPREESRAVLCIEDDAANARLIERILSHRSNIKALFATTGADGLALVREHRPDLILLDLDLPDLHGSEVLRRLRAEEQTQSVPVVVISADATATQIERLLSSGARNYLTKPIEVTRFLYTVDEILTGQ